ncbi:efflux RND transporter periplasmic adaptor subunit [Rhizobiaceae bacterium n13]|uniref:Efflux RND transporter periplasmic adaptor subunit n=1 Tax=Ferirhizobium litorale TaxID=2927786 RepID=A0AAE3QDW4_9HYPH|nr:efflux RND transporter periplasmic adaptor subunit [Fererhizobium litorale]MDI7861615.1 efflux RND transporter periplasmic adaptor subunit [Fererhizobium litorale]MDI7922043.1 efflux RND transporter periplasmic adaptor subunit [Fererhizobium litorale]
MPLRLQTLNIMCGISAIAALLFATGCQREDEAAELPPRPVKTVTVSFSPDDTFGSLVGEIQPRFETSFSFRQGGEVRERDVDVGNMIKSGDVIARLDSEDQQDAVRKAEANLFAAQATLENAETARARAQQQYPRTVSRAALDSAIAQASGARASVDAAEAALRIAKNNLDNRVLRANSDGVVTAVGAEVGQNVGGGQMIARIAQLQDKDAVFQVPESAIAAASRDLTIEASLLSRPDITAVGTVREISPVADPITRNFTVRVALDNPPEDFRFGSAVRGSVNLPGGPVARLPMTALFNQGNESAVWVVDPADSTTKLVPVTIQRFETQDFLVAKGIASGDRVVVAGAQQLRPGMPVRLLEGSL